MNPHHLVNFKGLSEELGLPIRTLRSLYHQKKIPALVLGHRTIRFSPARVRVALDKFEQKAVA
jgi:hypothetical protein